MKKQELLDLLDRVPTWPKEAREAVFDSLKAIEESRYLDPTIAEDLLRTREERQNGDGATLNS